MSKRRGLRMTLTEVAALLGISTSTLRKLLRDGPRESGERVLDVRLAEPLIIGGMRRWSRKRVLELLQ